MTRRKRPVWLQQKLRSQAHQREREPVKRPPAPPADEPGEESADATADGQDDAPPPMRRGDPDRRQGDRPPAGWPGAGEDGDVSRMQF